MKKEEKATKNFAEIICDFMNRLLDLDREAVENLVETRIPCNDALADDPKVPVFLDKDQIPKIGLLGVLNGLLRGVDEDIMVVGVFDKDGKLEKFRLISLNQKKMKREGDRRCSV